MILYSMPVPKSTVDSLLEQLDKGIQLLYVHRLYLLTPVPGILCSDCHQASTWSLAIFPNFPLEMCCFNRHHHGFDCSSSQTHCSQCSCTAASWHFTVVYMVPMWPLGYEITFPGLFPNLQQWYYLVKGSTIYATLKAEKSQKKVFKY